MIRITLTAYSMGPATTEADFDAWAAFVSENISDACGLDDVEIDQYDMNAGEGHDGIEGADDATIDAIRDYLTRSGWEAFCASRDEEMHNASVEIGTPDGFAY